MSRAVARRSSALGLAVAYALLILTWMIGNPPFAGADEDAHYVRALGIGQGQLAGPRAVYPLPANPTPHDVVMIKWLNDAARKVDVPGGLVFINAQCNSFNQRQSAACLNSAPVVTPRQAIVNPVGNYQPEAYFIPGWLALSADNPSTGDRLGRLAAGLVCWCFIALAVALSWRRDASSIVGLLLALTPMVVFTGSIINPSGLEIASALAFAAALLALRRGPRPSRRVWWAAGVSGVVLALSRTPGPAWILVDLIVVAALMGGRAALALVRTNRIAVLASGAAIVAAIGLNRIWESAYGSHLRLSWPGVKDQVRPAVHQLPNLLREQVGDFGWLDSPIALPLLAIWLLLILALIAVALRVGSGRERFVVAAITLVDLVATMAFYVLFEAGSSFAVQGRHLLPMTVLVPLVAGEVVFVNRQRLRIDHLRFGVGIGITLVAVVQFGAWYGNARRQSVGVDGPLWFAGRAAWSPPLGWWTWLIVTVLAAGLLAVAGLRALPHEAVEQPQELLRS